MSWILTFILDWIWGKISSLLARFASQKASQAEEQKKADDSVVPLEKAETAKDIDAASNSALDGF